MSAWWETYLTGVAVEAVPNFLRECGVPDRAIDGATQTVLILAARCRLAFAPIETVHDVLEPGSTAVPAQAIISRTTTHKRRGRPLTARWAYWTAFLVANSLGHSFEWKATSRQLASLGSVLAGRRVSAAEMRGQLARLKREAETHARAAADVLLEDPIKRGLTRQAFLRHMRANLDQDLDPATEYPPMIIHGRLNEAWLQRLTVVRQRILKAVQRHGSLGGEGPLLQLSSIAELRRGLPLGGVASPLGLVHLDKGLDMPIPTVAEPAGSIAITLSLDKPPYGAALCALPQWWDAWQAALHLPIEDASVVQDGEKQRTTEIGPAGRRASDSPHRRRGGRKPKARGGR